MKRLISLILTASCILLLIVGCSSKMDFETSLQEQAASDFLYDDVYNANIDWISSGEFILKLEEEGVNLSNSDEYDICLMIEAKESPEAQETTLLASNIIVTDGDYEGALIEHRKAVKEYYKNYNEAIVAEMGLNEYNYSVSFYSPYIEIVFDNILEYQKHESAILNSINNNQSVVASANSCAFYEQSIEGALVNNISYDEPYSIVDAYADIEINNSQFSGNNVRVGIIETALPMSTLNLVEGLYTLIDDADPSDTHRHPFVVSSIVGGTTGIAEGSHLYILDWKGFQENFNILINEYNVNVINASFGYEVTGNYTNYDRCIDRIIATTGCTVVKSAGNLGGSSTNPVITSPGCAMNAITVGAINDNKNIYCYSSWQTSADYLLKPDVVAPGGNLVGINGIPEDNLLSGTSYAAPMVTGTIALLMEEFPELKVHPDLVKSAIHWGAEMLPTQESYYDGKAGFGLINYQNTRQILLEKDSPYFVIWDDEEGGNELYTYTVYAMHMDVITINSNSIIFSDKFGNSEETAINSTGVNPYYTDYIIKIYDCQLEEYVATSVIDSSVDYLVFTNTNPNNSKFIVELILAEDNVSGFTEGGSVLIHSTHSHSYSGEYESFSTVQHKKYCVCGAYIYEDHNMVNHTCAQCEYDTGHSYTDHYAYQSALKHICYCSCGAEKVESHVLVRRPGGGGTFVLVCNTCGYVSGSTGTLNSIPSDYPHTENGSYILPSGIIVLVPEDEEAYLNGTLEFRTGEIM